MKDFDKLETPELIDLLVTYSADHSRMLNEGASEKEFAKCSLMIRALQTEIDERKQTPSNMSSTNPAGN